MKNHRGTVAYIGIGSNLGDRQANIRRALAILIQTPEIEVRRISSMLENPAVGEAEDAPDFLNAAVEVRTTLSAEALMSRLLEIEQALGRHRRIKWEPRIIDLDLLLYGDAIIGTDELIVPHPLMHERPFVLQPLAEIAPEAFHPTLQMTISGLLENLQSERRLGKAGQAQRP